MSVPLERFAYDFIVLRLVPHVHRYTSADIGVVLHARTAGFLDARTLLDSERIEALAPNADATLIVRYIETLEAVARGEAGGGALALLPPSERFHWLAAPRSDLLQSSPIHGGLTLDPARTLTELYSFYVDG